MAERISREECYITMALIMSKRSTCLRAQVGCILVNSITNKIVATGYNGAPMGSDHCLDVGCYMHNGHCIRTIHAEANAITSLPYTDDLLNAFCTHEPCWDCTKMLYAAGVRSICFLNSYLPNELRDARSKIYPDLKVVVWLENPSLNE